MPERDLLQGQHTLPPTSTPGEIASGEIEEKTALSSV